MIFLSINQATLISTCLGMSQLLYRGRLRRLTIVFPAFDPLPSASSGWLKSFTNSKSDAPPGSQPLAEKEHHGRPLDKRTVA